MPCFETEQAIRWGKAPDNPEILYGYLSRCEKFAENAKQPEAVRLLERVIELLTDVICDTCVPRQWRCLCLDNLYRPLESLHRMAVSQEDRRRLNKKIYEINALTRFFLTG